MLVRGGVATRIDTLALGKYDLQKPFKNELSSTDLMTILTKKRQVYNVVSLLQLTEEARAKRCVTNLEAAKKDFVRVDYLVMNKLESIPKYLGYKGFMDRETKVKLVDKIDDDYVRVELSELKDLTTGTRVRATSPKTELSLFPEKYVGIKMPSQRGGPRGKQVRAYNLAENVAVKELARSPNTYMAY